MERPIKGGYILISLGLIALSTSYSGSIDYDKISRTKKRIVLTGIKVGDTVMPDICVKPVYGNGTITFKGVYGFDIVVSSNNSVSVSENESEEVPNVEEAPSGTIASVLGLNEDGKVVKGSTLSVGTKLYNHNITFYTNSNSLRINVMSTRSSKILLTTSQEDIQNFLSSAVEVRCSASRLPLFRAERYSSPDYLDIQYIKYTDSQFVLETFSLNSITSVEDTVTEL